jgi:formylglycine-generating enzyme required for sulfatase activity
MEKPEHQVTLDDFYIGTTEVTALLWEQIMGWNNSYYACDNCAVNNISWSNMQLFINRLNQATGLIFRLPSEAEWEYAARGGTKSNNTTYSGSNSIEDVAWYDKNAKRKSHPVALKKPNELGLYDMTGNLWEFCHDDISRSAYSTLPEHNPLFIRSDDIKQTSMKVVRGGGYESEHDEMQVFRRDGSTSNVRMPDIGFRLAMSKK